MTPAEHSLARVRALAEGTLKLPTIRTVPVGWQVSPPRRVPIVELPEIALTLMDSSRARHGDAAVLLAQFQRQEPGRFTLKDILYFCSQRKRKVSKSALDRALERSPAQHVGRAVNAKLYQFPAVNH